MFILFNELSQVEVINGCILQLMKGLSMVILRVCCDKCKKEGLLTAGTVVCAGFYKVELFFTSSKDAECVVDRFDICHECLESGKHAIDLKRFFMTVAKEKVKSGKQKEEKQAKK